jgi:tetratricopeptide (TPR) repeat protein
MKNYLLPTVLLGTISLVGSALPVMALSPVEVQQTAKRTTVEIDRCDRGSGVIIQKNSNTYTVLTVAHKVRSSGCEIVTPDNRRYQASTVRIFPNNIDLAVVSFTSNTNYPVAKLANADRVEAGEQVYIAGFGRSAIAKPVFTFVKGDVVSNSNKPQRQGYSLIYTHNTQLEHSGSPIWDDRGELIAIHGSRNISPASQALNANVRVQTDYNLGITTNTFTKFATAAGIGGYTPFTIAAAPKPVDEAISIAVLKESQGDYRGMLAQMNNAVFLDSQNPRLYYIRGVAKSLLGNRDALGDYNRSIELQPDRAAVYNNRGVAKFDLGDNQGAIADFNRSISIDPKLARAYYNRGTAKVALKPKDALTDFNRAIAIDSKLARAYFSRGTLKAKLGDPQGELADFNRAIAIDPSYLAAHEQLGFAKFKLGDFKGAIVSFNQAIVLDAKNPKTYHSRANAKSQVGDDKGALEDYNKSIALNANDASAYASRGLVKSKLGDKKGAILDLKKAANRFKRQRQTASYQRAISELKRLGA